MLSSRDSGPFHWAVPFGDEEVVEFLIEAGVPVTAHIAAYLGLEDRLRMIIAENPESVNERLPGSWTPLHMAVFHDRPAIVQILLEAGCDPSVKNHKSMTALDRALVCGNKRAAKVIGG